MSKPKSNVGTKRKTNAKEKSMLDYVPQKKPGADYFLNLSTPMEISAQDYVAARTSDFPGITHSALRKEWNAWIQLFKKCDFGPWNEAAAKAPTLSRMILKEWLTKDSDSSLPLPMPPPPIADSSHESSSSITEVLEESSSSTSSGALSSGAVDRMKSEFSANFEKYTGSPWLLASGTNVDDTIFQHTMTLSVESSLHSFVLDRTEVLVGLFEDVDQGLFQEAIDRDASQEIAALAEWKRREIKRYSLSPKKLRDLRRSGWDFLDQQDFHATVDEYELDGFRERLHLTMSRFSSLYKHNSNKLPECRLESWFAVKVWDILMELLVTDSEWLDHGPGEISSSASSLRKNKDRSLETRHAPGRKVDGIITCKKFDFNCEIGAIEIGKTDDGPTGTKVLKDGRKISKILKDMFDLICVKCKNPTVFRSELRVYGLLISGLRVEFLSLRYLEGRYYHLVREETLTVPSSWNDSGIRSILILITKMLVFRDRIESMAKLANSRLSTDEEDLDRALSGLD
ncbi:hypothetical protein BGX26_001326, partial [Mortierella sp. AD094]